MTLDDLKRLNLYLTATIDRLEADEFVPMTQKNKDQFRAQYGDAHLVVGEFIIGMIQCSSPTTPDSLPSPLSDR